jgi:hypothetical protein
LPFVISAKEIILNKNILIFIFLFTLITTTSFAQFPSNWHINPPRDTASHVYKLGVSQPSANEQEALIEAWQDAVRHFASSIATRYQGQIDISVQSRFLSSEIKDTFTVTVETSSFTTNVPISGVREEARMIEREAAFFIARVLLSMTTEDFNKARQYVNNEEAVALAYRFFGQKNLFHITQNQKPAGYDDYYSWLRNNCVIIAVNDPNVNDLLPHMDQFIVRLYRNAVIFPHIIDGFGARIIYNSQKYYSGILSALQNTSLFNIQREGTS